MSIIEVSSMNKSLSFTDSRLYGREAVYFILNILLSQPKGGLYETPSLGFDRRDLLFYSMGSDEYELVKGELETLLRKILKTQDGIEIDFKRAGKETVTVSISVRDTLGNVVQAVADVDLSGKEQRYKPVRVR
nr:MAG TPA: lysozyme [Caudoviricetes sp.]